MKKFFAIFLLSLFFTACSLENDVPNYTLKIVPIESFIVPTQFTYGVNNNITVKYTFPTNCYFFYDLYYTQSGYSRIIAISARDESNGNCQVNNEMNEFTFPIKVTQREDYILKFWKGKDANGDDIYEEVIVPVN